MKKIIFFCFCIPVFLGCKDSGNSIVDTKEAAPLHFSFDTSHNIEPIALLDFGGLYHLVYGVSFKSDTGTINTTGRLTSKDLIHWSKSSKSFLPKYNNSILQGGIIIDSNNTTGYGTRATPPLVAVLTRSNNEEDIKRVIPMLAFSTDAGNTWTETTDSINFPEAFTDNPQNINIFWHQPTRKWIASLALTDHVELYSSEDLRSWKFESLLGADFFPEEIKWKRTNLVLSVDGTHWILLADIKKSGKNENAGGTVYFVGSFDGHNFINQSSQLHWLDYGEDMYGSLTSAGGDGRMINVGWRNDNGIQSSKTGMHVPGFITIPRKLDLENINTEWFINASPVVELKSRYGKEIKLEPVTVSYKVDDIELISEIKIPVEIFLKFNTSDIQKGSFPTRFGVSFSNNEEEHIKFGFDRFGHYYLDKSGILPSLGIQTDSQPVKMPSDHSDSTMSLRFIVDNSTIECFAEGGKLVMTSTYSSNEPFTSLKLFAENGNIEFIGGKVIELRKQP